MQMRARSTRLETRARGSGEECIRTLLSPRKTSFFNVPSALTNHFQIWRKTLSMCSGTYWCVDILSFLAHFWTVMRREWITRRTAEASARLPPFQASRSSPFSAPPTRESGQQERTVPNPSRGSGRCPCRQRTTAAPVRTRATATALSPVYQSPATRTSLWTSPASVSDILLS